MMMKGLVIMKEVAVMTAVKEQLYIFQGSSEHIRAAPSTIQRYIMCFTS